MLGHHGISEAPISALRQAGGGPGPGDPPPDSFDWSFVAPTTRMHYDAAGQIHYWAWMAQAEYTAGNGLKHFTVLDDEPEYSTEH